jgi:hypothetical protein
MRRIALLLICGLTASAPVAAQDTSVAVTLHTARIRGTTLRYSAQVGRLPIRPMNGEEPHGYMSYVAYRLPSPSGRPRPIMFAWGGGPSAPAISLHMTYGPKRVERGELVDNQNTLLTVTDLVFVDPIGTGFSRPTKPEYAAEFYNVRGDAAAMAEFIRVFRAKYDPRGSPLFLRGGSYGVWRATFVAELLERSGVRVAGLSLRSGGIQLGADALPRSVVHALRTPGRAAAALHHGKLAPEVGTTLDAVLRSSEAWAMTTYAPALERVASLTDAERETIAQQLSQHTGYPAAKIDRQTLVITPRAYMTDGLIAGRNLSTNDLRVVSGSPPAGGAEGRNADDTRIARYLRVDLGYRTDLAYLGDLERGYMPTPGPAYQAPGSSWGYNTGAAAQPGSAELAAAMAAAQAGEGPPGTEPWLRRALEINPTIKVNVHAGLYDSLNSCAVNQELMRRYPQYAPNFHLRCFLSGHSLQLDPRVALDAGDDLRAWIESSTR